MSANANNEIKPGPMHRYPGIYFMTEEIPGKPQQRDSVIKGVKWGPKHPTDVGTIVTVRQGGRRKERRKG